MEKCVTQLTFNTLLTSLKVTEPNMEAKLCFILLEKSGISSLFSSFRSQLENMVTDRH